MKWQISAARLVMVVGIALFGVATSPVLAQTNSANNLNAELSQAICQQDWAKAIRIVDRMRVLVPADRRSELTLYRNRLHAMLTSQTMIPGLQCAGGSSSLTATPRPSP